MREAPQFIPRSRVLRRAGRWFVLLAGAFLLMVLLFESRAQTEEQHPAPPKAAATPAADSHSDSVPPTAVDSQHLLQLADLLRAEMAKTTRNQLSIPVLRQADAIEKLARQMRSR